MKYKFLIIQILVVFFTTNIFASTKIKILDLEEYKISENKILYKIKAESKSIDYKKLKKFRIYNKERVISNSSFYTNGKFLSKELNITFKKGYFLEGNFIMLDLHGFYKNNKFRAKKASYRKKDLFMKNVFISIDDKKYKKFKYSLPLE
ncbi:hypothetical protein [Poseidonibacter lekithochrous]|uniref:hypothetical protein n=1 Tax=Poseidonibacter lekithochrous TaxID=1904463 RepID=UPI000D3C257C|nr:hypothetical protein [Poseidonibacter lekithochrous]